MRRRIFFFLLCSLFTLQAVRAQEFVGGGADNFQWRLIGRVFFDGGVFFHDTTDLGNSFQVNDLRLGAVLRFLENWEAKIELGYGDSKVSLKDVYLNYAFSNHSLRLGHFYEPFGNARVGSTNYRLMTNAVADKILGNSRRLGITYSYYCKAFNFMGGVFSDGDIQKSKPRDQGYNVAAKAVVRPWMQDRKVVHIGVAPRFSSGQDQVTFRGGVPTDLLNKEDDTFLKAEVSQVINQWKLDLELILTYNKWYFQGQYYLAHLNRSAADNYNARGGYAQAGYMILGAEHNYNPRTGMIANPAPRSLEVVVRYNNVNLNDAGIRGGRMSDVTAGMNYFINKYVVAKVNYTRLMMGHSALRGGQDFNLLQGRIQFFF